MINYSHHAGSKDITHDERVSYGAAQLLQERHEIRFHSDTTQPPFGSQSEFITDSMLPRHPAPHYNAHCYKLSPPQDNKQRQHIDNEADSSHKMNRNHATRPMLHDLPGNTSASEGESTVLTYPAHNEHASPHQALNHDCLTPVSLPLPQQHHHHWLPSQAMIHTNPNGDSSGPTSAMEEEMDLSFMDQPGLPPILPQPRTAKCKFGNVEDDTLIVLKERWGFTWKQISLWFPGRTSGTLQVRYCTKLKVKNVVWTDEMVCFLLAS
jgi:hypothetical protein